MVVDTKKSGFGIPTEKTHYRRTYEASPFFEFSNSEIPASGYWTIDLEQQKLSSRKYLPLSNLRITNNSASAITIFINQRTEGITVPAGVIISLDKASMGTYYSLRILNLNGSAVISVNELKISCWREGIVVDEAFKRMHKAFYKGLFGRS